VGETGPTGATGPGFTFRGPYNNGSQYYVDHVVTYENSSWVCIQTIDGVAPAENNWWTIFVAQGVTGPTGPVSTEPSSVPGPTGPTGSWNYSSTTAPTGATEGDAWFDPNTGGIFIYYDGYWVEAGAAPVGPTGPSGNDGATGPTGAQGATGPTGLAGDAGSGAISIAWWLGV
jgi:hypothetical protein